VRHAKKRQILSNLKLMKKYLLTFILLVLITKYGKAQFIDKYGINIGASYSDQFWDYKLISIDNPNKDYKIGFLAFLSAEKKISKMFSIRSEIGYIQKGFKNNVEMTSSDGTSAGVNKENVIFHDLAANIGLKITPFDLKFSPYMLIGLSADYMISYKDIIFEEQGSGLKFNMYQSEIEKFKKLNLGGLIGIGFELNDLIYLEIEYNPSITNSYSSKGLDIKDNCWGIKIGFNINKLMTK
jgi:hypothetical protein